MRFITRRATTVVAAGLLTALVASAAIADDHTATVTQSVNPGSLTAGLTDLGLEAVDYRHTAQQSAGTLTLTVDDSSATGDGWNVSVIAGNFVYSGDNRGDDIDANMFALTSAGTPTHVAGQEIDGDAVRAVTTQLASLDQARVVIEADAEHGQGVYAQDLGVELTIPGQSRAGTYTGTVTTTATAGPTTAP